MPSEDHQDLLRTTAKVYALEAVVLALFKYAPNKESVLQHFQLQKETFAGRLLHEADLKDEALHELNEAHEYILKLLTTARS